MLDKLTKFLLYQQGKLWSMKYDIDKVLRMTLELSPDQYSITHAGDLNISLRIDKSLYYLEYDVCGNYPNYYYEITKIIDDNIVLGD